MTATSKTSPSEGQTFRERCEARRAEYPTCCPQCFDDSKFCPTFDGLWWQCEGCGWMWES